MSWSSRSGPQLAVDVLDMGAADDPHIDAEADELFDLPAYRCRVGTTVGDRGAIPVKRDRLEAPLQRIGPRVKRGGVLRGWLKGRHHANPEAQPDGSGRTS